MFYNIIACIDNNNGLSKDNIIPWKNKNDMLFFKNKTTKIKNESKHNVVVMGYQTYIYCGYLKNRINIVLTKDHLDYNYNPNCIILNSINNILLYCEKNKKNIENVYIIGGSLYSQFLKLDIVDYIYLNVINDNYGCDKFFDMNLIKKKFKHIDITYLNNEITFYTYKFYNKSENKYISLINKILIKGIFRNDRTNDGTLSLFGKRIKYDVRNNKIPLFTTKYTWFKGVVEELLFFIKGETNTKLLENKKVNIWKGNTSREFLDNRGLQHYDEGDMGAAYGFLLRHWGAEYINCNTNYENQGYDQLKYIINEIKNNPTSRRILYSYWNPSYEKQQAIPSCFTSDTLVLTNKGYKKIQDIKPGDHVISHSLKSRKVLNKQEKLFKNNMVYLYHELSNIPIMTTKEHPFLINNMMYVKANDITTDDSLTIKLVDTKYTIISDMFYIYGYFYKNYNNSNCIVYIYNETSLNNINKILTNNGYKKLKSNYLYEYIVTDINLVYKINYMINESNFYKILINFNITNIKYFMNGYYDASLTCFYFFNDKFISVIDLINKSDEYNLFEYSYQRALFLQYITLYTSETLYIKKIIYNNSDVYQLVKIKNNLRSIMDGNTVLPNIVNKKYIKRKTIVYNLEVDFDNTYIVENMIVHNCAIITQFYCDTINNELNCQFYNRSCDVALGLPFNVASAAVLLNILCYYTGYKPGEIIHVIGDAHIYKSHIESIKEHFKRDAYTYPILMINNTNIKKIEDLTYEDFTLIKYNYHDKITMKMIA